MFIVSFPAIPELGYWLDFLDSQLEPAHRVMAMNLSYTELCKGADGSMRLHDEGGTIVGTKSDSEIDPP